MIGKRVVGEMKHEVHEASRALDDGSVYRQRLIVGREVGGANVGRCVSASFERSDATGLDTRLRKRAAL